MIVDTGRDEADLYVGDCREVLAGLEESSVDAVVCDPPYELGFMGRSWDLTGVAYQPETWAAALRVLKPGGHLLAFGGTRTYHRMTVAIEDAGFEVRDCLAWLYGSGFPKSLNVGGGFGTALKPAHEPIVMARKPLTGTVAANVLEHGTGALNVDGCRVATDDRFGGGAKATPGFVDGHEHDGWTPGSDAGRWPANVVLGHSPECEDICTPDCPIPMLDEQSGASKSTGGRVANISTTSQIYGGGKGLGMDLDADAVRGDPGYGDLGGASRFFYCAKAGRDERAGGDHPTVKPLALMRWLVRLVTPPGGVVLDPFAGSGTTGEAALIEGFRVVLVEQHEPYIKLIQQRLDKPVQPVLEFGT